MAGITFGEATAPELPLAPPGKPRGLARRAWDVFAENKLALAGLGFTVFILLFCFVGPLFYHTNQVNTDLSNYLCKPSGGHLLGCNELGYDQLGRLMIGGQTSLEVGIAAASVAVLFGALYGAISGFAGGVVDSVMMRVVDAGLSLPYLMVVIILSVIFHPNPAVMIFIIAVFYWFGVARLVRGETLSLRTREYVQAVRVIGGGQLRSVTRHVLPNAIGVVIVQATFAVADSILTLSGLGFLGLGVTPPATDWGSMLSGGLNYIQGGNYWWLIYPPGVAIILTCISFNFIGDALRDAFETRLQRR
ncbi:MAG: peptide/nickel transport system permease protein [Trebonia sp.]|jgi:peptide/nickel transport system permease protein|nr:transporter permease [Actinomycetes bacterium]MDX6343085.1 peptide/nickel transport system permease protein [Trebonia sp.]